MREIKFRSWDKSAKKMSNLYNLQKQPTFNSEYNGKFCISTIRPSDWLGFDSLSENERQIAMQYTGLKDKNGVEIYEGDIVRYTTCTKDKYTFNLEVLYEEELTRFHARGRYSNSSVIFSLTCDSVLDAEIKVIGNIYENQDLLNKI